ncbi:uncharacterized protein [Spinacia oleracea]|uniref:Reverse transcriptase zinc-binding domain-containing protein n=1 Tax=Spinacia oleracea TaxID=3562 RepID=A0A9R0IHG5_SPIOL|nr:uncharacterized protein LOC110788742 [Spinacia oleracea]
MCLPRCAGGWNIKNMEVWNKAAVCKLLWAITNKKDKLWVRWVDSYYMRGRDVAGFKCPSTMSWSLKKIFGCWHLIESVGGWQAVVKNGAFSIKLMYQKLNGVHNKVSWRRIVCNNKATPKSLFVLWMALWNRMPTLDRLLQWKIVNVNSCLMCGSAEETVDHLFFKCSISSQVWQKVLALLHFSRPATGFTEEIQWMIKSSKRGSGRHKLLLMFFSECTYTLWLNRNNKLFNNHCKEAVVLFREVVFRVAARAPTDLSDLLTKLSCR